VVTFAAAGGTSHATMATGLAQCGQAGTAAVACRRRSHHHWCLQRALQNRCRAAAEVQVSAVLGQLAAGRSIEEIVIDYPYLERDDVLAALEFAAAAVQERELPLAQPA
jgi:Protein of unknown function (DUF433)